MTLTTQRLLDSAWTQCWQVAILAVAVGAIVALACRRRPHVAYLLWMLVVVKALTPPLVPSPTGVFSWALAERHVAPAPSSQKFNFTGVAHIEPAAKTPETRPTKNDDARAPIPSELPVAKLSTIEHVTYRQVLLALWGIGIVVLSGYTLTRWLLLMRVLRSTRQLVSDDLGDQFQAIARQLGMRRRPRLVVTSRLFGPAAFGWWPGTVILPQSLVAAKSFAELSPILAHELVHLRRFDTLGGSLQLAAQLIWWFHPAVWWANRQARVERERACDEEVLATLSYPAADYARMLVEILAWRNQLPTALPWPAMRGRDVTKRRLQHLLHGRPKFTARTPRIGWLVLLLVAVVVLPGAGLQLKATQPTEPKAHAQPITGSTFAVNTPEPAQAPREPTAEQQATIDKLKKLGFVISPIENQNSKLRFVASFNSELRPLSEPLPLADFSMLDQISVRARKDHDDLSAQLSALRNLRPETTLHLDLRASDGAAFNRLAGIPGLTRLMLTGVLPPLEPGDRTVRLDQLSNLKHLTCFFTDSADAPDELRGATKLEELVLNGNHTDAQLTPLENLISLKSLSLSAGMAEPLDLPWVARLANLEVLHVGQPISDLAMQQIERVPKLKGLLVDSIFLTDSGIKRIGHLPKLEVLYLFGHLSSQVTAQGLMELALLPELRSLNLLSHGDSGDLESCYVTDDVMLRWSALSKLRVLQINCCQLSPRGAAALAEFRDLRSLALHGTTGLTDAMPQLSRHLRELSLTIPHLTDRGMSQFANLVQLESLLLKDAHGITDAGLAELEPLAALTSLTISHADLSAPGIASLGKLPRLAELKMAECTVADSALDELTKLNHLKTLSLSNCGITDQQVKALASLTTLRELDLGINPITDAALTSLGDLKQLSRISLYETKTTEAGRKRLADELPSASIDANNFSGWAHFRPRNEYLDD